MALAQSVAFFAGFGIALNFGYYVLGAVLLVISLAPYALCFLLEHLKLPLRASSITLFPLRIRNATVVSDGKTAVRIGVMGFSLHPVNALLFLLFRKKNPLVTFELDGYSIELDVLGSAEKDKSDANSFPALFKRVCRVGPLFQISLLRGKLITGIGSVDIGSVCIGFSAHPSRCLPTVVARSVSAALGSSQVLSIHHLNIEGDFGVSSSNTLAIESVKVDFFSPENNAGGSAAFTLSPQVLETLLRVAPKEENESPPVDIKKVLGVLPKALEVNIEGATLDACCSDSPGRLGLRLESTKLALNVDSSALVEASVTIASASVDFAESSRTFSMLKWSGLDAGAKCPLSAETSLQPEARIGFGFGRICLDKEAIKACYPFLTREWMPVLENREEGHPAADRTVPLCGVILTSATLSGLDVSIKDSSEELHAMLLAVRGVRVEAEVVGDASGLIAMHGSLTQVFCGIDCSGEISPEVIPLQQKVFDLGASECNMRENSTLYLTLRSPTLFLSPESVAICATMARSWQKLIPSGGATTVTGSDSPIVGRIQVNLESVSVKLVRNGEISIDAEVNRSTLRIPLEGGPSQMQLSGMRVIHESCAAHPILSFGELSGWFAQGTTDSIPRLQLQAEGLTAWCSPSFALLLVDISEEWRAMPLPNSGDDSSSEVHIDFTSRQASVTLELESDLLSRFSIKTCQLTSKPGSAPSISVQSLLWKVSGQTEPVLSVGGIEVCLPSGELCCSPVCTRAPVDIPRGGGDDCIASEYGMEEEEEEEDYFSEAESVDEEEHCCPVWGMFSETDREQLQQPIWRLVKIDISTMGFWLDHSVDLGKSIDMMLLMYKSLKNRLHASGKGAKEAVDPALCTDISISDFSFRLQDDPSAQDQASMLLRRASMVQPPLLSVKGSYVQVTLHHNPEIHGIEAILPRLLELDECERAEELIKQQGGLADVMAACVHFSWTGMRVQLKNLPLPAVSSDRLDLGGLVALVEHGAPDFAVYDAEVAFSGCVDRRVVPRVVKVTRALMPMKTYHDMGIVALGMKVVHGPCMERGWDDVADAFDRIDHASIDPSPVLPWWDKLRYMMHGSARFVARDLTMRLLCSGDLDPEGLQINASAMEVIFRPKQVTMGCVDFKAGLAHLPDVPLAQYAMNSTGKVGVGESSALLDSGSMATVPQGLALSDIPLPFVLIPQFGIRANFCWKTIGEPSDHFVQLHSPYKLVGDVLGPAEDGYTVLRPEHDTYRQFRTQEAKFSYTVDMRPDWGGRVQENKGPCTTDDAEKEEWSAFDSLRLPVSPVEAFPASRDLCPTIVFQWDQIDLLRQWYLVCVEDYAPLPIRTASAIQRVAQNLEEGGLSGTGEVDIDSVSSFIEQDADDVGEEEDQDVDLDASLSLTEMLLHSDETALELETEEGGLDSSDAVESEGKEKFKKPTFGEVMTGVITAVNAHHLHIVWYPSEESESAILLTWDRMQTLQAKYRQPLAEWVGITYTGFLEESKWFLLDLPENISDMGSCQLSEMHPFAVPRYSDSAFWLSPQFAFQLRTDVKIDDIVSARESCAELLKLLSLPVDDGETTEFWPIRREDESGESVEAALPLVEKVLHSGLTCSADVYRIIRLRLVWTVDIRDAFFEMFDGCVDYFRECEVLAAHVKSAVHTRGKDSSESAMLAAKRLLDGADFSEPSYPARKDRKKEMDPDTVGKAAVEQEKPTTPTPARDPAKEYILDYLVSMDDPQFNFQSEETQSSLLLTSTYAVMEGRILEKAEDRTKPNKLEIWSKMNKLSGCVAPTDVDLHSGVLWKEDGVLPVVIEETSLEYSNTYFDVPIGTKTVDKQEGEVIFLSMPKLHMNMDGYQFLQFLNTVNTVLLAPPAQEELETVFVDDDGLHEIKVSSRQRKDYHSSTSPTHKREKSATPVLSEEQIKEEIKSRLTELLPGMQQRQNAEKRRVLMRLRYTIDEIVWKLTLHAGSVDQEFATIEFRRLFGDTTYYHDGGELMLLHAGDLSMSNLVDGEVRLSFFHANIELQKLLWAELPFSEEDRQQCSFLEVRTSKQSSLYLKKFDRRVDVYDMYQISLFPGIVYSLHFELTAQMWANFSQYFYLSDPVEARGKHSRHESAGMALLGKWGDAPPTRQASLASLEMNGRPDFPRQRHTSSHADGMEAAFLSTTAEDASPSGSILLSSRGSQRRQVSVSETMVPLHSMHDSAVALLRGDAKATAKAFDRSQRCEHQFEMFHVNASAHAHVIVGSAEAAMLICDVCNTKIGGAAKQGVRCGLCGITVHRECRGSAMRKARDLLGKSTVPEYSFFRYVRVGDISLSLTARGFLITIEDFDAKLSGFAMHDKLCTWEKFFDSIRSKLVWKVTKLAPSLVRRTFRSRMSSSTPDDAPTAEKEEEATSKHKSKPSLFGRLKSKFRSSAKPAGEDRKEPDEAETRASMLLGLGSLQS